MFCRAYDRLLGWIPEQLSPHSALSSTYLPASPSLPNSSVQVDVSKYKAKDAIAAWSPKWRRMGHRETVKRMCHPCV